MVCWAGSGRQFRNQRSAAFGAEPFGELRAVPSVCPWAEVRGAARSRSPAHSGESLQSPLAWQWHHMGTPHGWENSGVWLCPSWATGSSSHGMAWLEVLSAGRLHIRAAACASSLGQPLRFMLGLQSCWDSKKKSGEWDEGRGRREQSESEGFSRQKHRVKRGNGSSCISTLCLSTLQWMLCEVPQKYVISCQPACFRTFVLIILKLAFQFLFGWEFFGFIHRKKKKICFFIPHKIKPHTFWSPTGFQLACNARSISLLRPKGK